MVVAPPPFLWPEEAPAGEITDRLCPTCGDTTQKALICQAPADGGAPMAPAALRDLRVWFCPSPGYRGLRRRGHDRHLHKPTSSSRGRRSLFSPTFWRISANRPAQPMSRSAAGSASDWISPPTPWAGEPRAWIRPSSRRWGRDLLGVDITLAYFSPDTVADTSCDIVMATEVLEHLPDPLAFLRDIRRSLRPDGIVVLTTPDVAAVRPAIAKSALNPDAVDRPPTSFCTAAPAWRARCGAAGLSHVRIDSDGWKLTAFASGVPLDLRGRSGGAACHRHSLSGRPRGRPWRPRRSLLGLCRPRFFRGGLRHGRNRRRDDLAAPRPRAQSAVSHRSRYDPGTPGGACRSALRRDRPPSCRSTSR